MFIVDNVMKGLEKIPSESVHCIVTSPPYFQVRDYGHTEQWGLEADLSDYLYKMYWLAGDLRRVLRPDGICWVNIGDKYIDKNLCGIPWKVADRFKKQGWRLRSAIVWEKPNCVPSSVKDRPTSSYEMLFLFSQLPKYFYDSYNIREGIDPESIKRMTRKFSVGSRNEPDGMNPQSLKPDQMCHPAGRNARDVWTIPSANDSHGHFSVFPEELVRRCIKAGTSDYGACGACGAQYEREIAYYDPAGKLGSDWNKQGTNTGRKDLSRGHPRVPSGDNRPVPYTKEWKKTCQCETKEIISATVLDPFMGSGTTAVVSEKLNRKWIGIDINPDNKKLTKERLGVNQWNLYKNA